MDTTILAVALLGPPAIFGALIAAETHLDRARRRRTTPHPTPPHTRRADASADALWPRIRQRPWPDDELAARRRHPSSSRRAAE